MHRYLVIIQDRIEHTTHLHTTDLYINAGTLLFIGGLSPVGIAYIVDVRCTGKQIERDLPTRRFALRQLGKELTHLARSDTR